MSKFADGYSRYLTNHFNYVLKYETFRKYFKNSVASLTDPKFVSKMLISKKDEFPKYPYFFNAIVRTDNVNLVKIYNSTMDNTDKLLEAMVGATELGKKELYDSIPSSLDNFLAELNFQFAYISTPTDLYNFDLILKSFSTEYQYRNFFNDLYTPLFNNIDGETAGLEDKSFLYQYMLYCCLYNVLPISHNIYSKLFSFTSMINETGEIVDRVDQASMLSGFQTFISNYDDTMSIDLSNIISKSLYGFQSISKNMFDNLITVISGKITNGASGLYNSFYNFYNPLPSLAPITFLSNNATQLLNAVISSDIITQIYNNDNIIDQDMTSHQTLYEDDTYSIYMSKIEESQLKNYLFLCFLYKFWPVKFLNILQLTLKEYTEQLIKSVDEDALSTTDYGDIFKTFTTTYINYTNLETFLNSYMVPTDNIVIQNDGTHSKFTFIPGTTSVQCADLNSFMSVNIHECIYADGDNRSNAVRIMSKKLDTVTLFIEDEYTGSISTPNVDIYRYTLSPTNYLYDISTRYSVSEFSCVLYYLYILDEYFNSTIYNTFIQELAEDIFVYLRDNGHVNYTFNWYEYHETIDVYFKTYFRWKLLDQSKRCVLPDYKNAMYRFTNSSTIVYCADKKSYDQIVDGDYIFSGQDTIANANQVISHSYVAPLYMLNLDQPYTGQTTNESINDRVYYYKTTDTRLFDNVTQNFSNKLYPKVITNTTPDATYDIDIHIPDANDLQNYFNTFSSSTSFIRSMHQFSENLMLSTLTRETGYSVLSEFI